MRGGPVAGAVRAVDDFGRFVLPWGHRYALVVVLSYSRLLWLRFYRSQTMTVLTSGLERAFERFEDVPDELRPPAGSEWTSKPAIRGKLPPPPEGFKGSGQLDVAGLWEMSITRAADYALQTQ